MTFNSEVTKNLTAPLARSAVKERTQAGQKLSYIESWHAISEANRIFGFDGWNSHTRLKKLFDPYKDGKDKWRVGYMAKVTVMVRDGADWVARDGVGYGSGIDNDLGQSHEKAIKEAESDARKRALMTFGNPFGLALYDKDQANVMDDAPEPPPVEDITQRKNPPGRHKVITGVRDFAVEFRSCTDSDQLLAYINTEQFKKDAFRVCCDFPNDWLGHEDNSGLSGALAQRGQQLLCADDVDRWIHRMERARDERKKPKAAAE